jgi:hypothetical protein
VALRKNGAMAQRKRRIDIQDATMLDLSKQRINPWTNKPYSGKYWEILHKRQTLPVFQFLQDIQEKTRNNQVVVVEGETGSGKTTQVNMNKCVFSVLSALALSRSPSSSCKISPVLAEPWRVRNPDEWQR